jgi:hypothetical protein
MARINCMSAATVLSFLAGGLIGVGVALLVSPEPAQIKEKLRSAFGRKEKLSREQIIEEGIQCAVPEGADICYPGHYEKA